MWERLLVALRSAVRPCGDRGVHCLRQERREGQPGEAGREKSKKSPISAQCCQRYHVCRSEHRQDVREVVQCVDGDDGDDGDRRRKEKSKCCHRACQVGRGCASHDGDGNGWLDSYQVGEQA